MKKTFIWKGNNQQLIQKGRKVFSELDPEVEYIVRIEENKPIRSNDHNRYYRFVLKTIAIHTGETTDRLHMLFKCMFNFEEFTLPNGDIRRIPATTSDKNKSEFAKYINQVKQWARNEYAVSIPERGDFDLMREMEIEIEYDKIQG